MQFLHGYSDNRENMNLISFALGIPVQFNCTISVCNQSSDCEWRIVNQLVLQHRYLLPGPQLPLSLPHHHSSLHYSQDLESATSSTGFTSQVYPTGVHVQANVSGTPCKATLTAITEERSTMYIKAQAFTTLSIKLFEND